MGWRIANSLEQLRKQLNTAFPNRSKASDGGIGDAAHASRSSDHNPWVKDSHGVGVVTARDFTHDPKGGLDCHWLAKQLVRSRDSRIKYIIWNRQICSSEKSPWQWRPYSGANAHTHHLHISVKPQSQFYDSIMDWDLDIAVTKSPLAGVTESEADKIIEENLVPIDSAAEKPAAAVDSNPPRSEDQPPKSEFKLPNVSGVIQKAQEVNQTVRSGADTITQAKETIGVIKEFVPGGGPTDEAQKVTTGKSKSFWMMMLAKFLVFLEIVLGVLKDNWKLVALGTFLFVVLVLVLVWVFYNYNKLKMVFFSDPTRINVE